MIEFFSNSQEKLKIEDFITMPLLNWDFETNYPIFASPILSQNIMFIGGLDSLLHAIDLNSGKELWNFRTKDEIRSNACANKEKIYLNGGDGNLYALNKFTGELIWKFVTQGEKKYDFADYFHYTPIIREDILYFGSGDGYLYAVHAQTGKPVWFLKRTTSFILLRLLTMEKSSLDHLMEMYTR
jgi:outer membrane protein assembly factor BamB